LVSVISGTNEILKNSEGLGKIFRDKNKIRLHLLNNLLVSELEFYHI